MSYGREGVYILKHYVLVVKKKHMIEESRIFFFLIKHATIMI
jgi:hypothetical protein